jgi:hypothetical protein
MSLDLLSDLKQRCGHVENPSPDPEPMSRSTGVDSAPERAFVLHAESGRTVITTRCASSRWSTRDSSRQHAVGGRLCGCGWWVDERMGAALLAHGLTVRDAADPENLSLIDPS